MLYQDEGPFCFVGRKASQINIRNQRGGLEIIEAYVKEASLVDGVTSRLVTESVIPQGKNDSLLMIFRRGFRTRCLQKLEKNHRAGWQGECRHS